MTEEDDTSVGGSFSFEDGDDLGPVEPKTLTNHLFQSHSVLSDETKPLEDRLSQARETMEDADAYVTMSGLCQGHLPAFDCKTFRKAYTFLFWLRPRISSEEVETKEAGASNVLPPSNYLYRLSTHSQDVTANGVCVTCSLPWKLSQDGKIVETMLTAYTLPHVSSTAFGGTPSPASSFVQTPLRLSVDQWSLVGITHTFPYLKRPMWTLVVNGALQDQGPLDYPVIDQQVLEYNLFLQNVVQQPLQQAIEVDERKDYMKSASQLVARPTTRKVQWEMDWACLSVYPRSVGPTLQALACHAGVSTCLANHGRILPSLPPVANWSKGSALEGPKVGVPLVVHAAALDIQRTAGSLLLAVGAHHVRIMSAGAMNRMVCTHIHVPGDTNDTPRVGLVQPQPMFRLTEDEAPVYYLVGEAKMYSAMRKYCNTHSLLSGSENLLSITGSLTVAKQEQGLLVSLVLPFFFALGPPSFDKKEVRKSFHQLHSLLTNDGALASALVGNLATCIRKGGSRVHEEVLQNGIIHVLASSLRQLLCRAYLHRFFEKSSWKLEAWLKACQSHPEDSRRLERPPFVPQSIIDAILDLVDACCGPVGRMDDLEPHEQIQRTCDLALTTVFGLCLDTDLWRNANPANSMITAAVADRYGDDCWTGGYLLRSQMSVQFLLDTVRAKPAARLLQSMLISSLSNTRSITQGEYDVAACVNALCEAHLGSTVADVVLHGLMNILVWCEIFPDITIGSSEEASNYPGMERASSDGGSGTLDQKMEVASRLGRNLLISGFHDVVAPMILSRTAFSGENKDSLPWNHHWQISLLLFSWVTSLAGPDGVPPAISTGNLLLASGIAGSLNGALADADKSLLSALFLPPPAIALMIGVSMRDEWSYTDLLADRLQIMMPLLPGLVVSFLPNPVETGSGSPTIATPSLKALCSLLTSACGAFHRVYGGTIHSTEGNRSQTKPNQNEISEAVKAARAYVPYFLSVVMLLERHLVNNRHQENDVVTVLKPQTSNEALRRTDMESWVDVTSESLIGDAEVCVSSDQEGSETTLCTLFSCQKTVLSTTSGLVANAMKLGGAGASISLWIAVLEAFGESLTFFKGESEKDSRDGAFKSEREQVVRDVICRLAAEVLCKALRRDYQWEVWSNEMGSAVSRLCLMLEEKTLLVPLSNGKFTKDQVVLMCTLADVLEYGRDATGWCQLTLPTMSTSESSGDLSAASKLLLPVLQPCLRLVLESLPFIETTILIRAPVDPSAALKNKEESATFTEELLLSRLLVELDLTLTAAIVGLTFSAARDTALGAMAMLRRTINLLLSTGSHDDAVAQCSSLLCKLTGELRERYKGERRLRDTALFDAYDGSAEGDHSASAIEESNAVERLILGGNVFGEGNGTPKSTEASLQGIEGNKGISADMVIFNELQQEAGKVAKLGYSQYEGLSAALDECENVIQSNEKQMGVNLSNTLAILQKFLDAWDAAMVTESEEAELVGLFDSVMLSAPSSASEELVKGLGSRAEDASETMSTFFELAASEKSRLKEVNSRHIPSYRSSRSSYMERFCWARIADCFPEVANRLWERGVHDGSRDVRARVTTYPVTPQFPRYLPKYLDHGSGVASENKSPEGSKQHRKSSVVEIDELTKNLLEAGNLEIVDITKKEVVDDHPPEDEFPKPSDDFLDDELSPQAADDGPREAKSEMDPKEGPSEQSAAESDSQFRDGDSRDDEPMPQKPLQHSITSSAFATPPDNASSSLGLMNSAAASLIELHMEKVLQVRAEGSRNCTLLLTRTHLILEYDGGDEGFYEGELIAAREEADRQRLIDEAGGAGGEASDQPFLLRAEKRQRDQAALRPKSVRFNLSEASHIYLRRYRLRDSSLEIFFIPTGGSAFGGYGAFSPTASIFLDFGAGYEGNERRDSAAFAIMKRTPPQAVKHWPDRSEQFIHEQLSRLTMSWIEGRVSNFDYLLHLNMLAGRSYNDICQYPVMPWVLADYTSKEVPDLTDRKNFRDLTKPVGALNEERLEDFLERFESFADPFIPKFMYGSHYSTSAGVVLHFLVRLHPFAGLHRQLQSGHFDVADRLFSSVPRTWSMCTGSSAAEVKELTPEWYCNPAFLRNSNNFKLGTSQDGEVIDDVVLPPWADGSPDKFVEIMRAALESEICSEMLPDWIDLIFGRKQQGSEAVKARNVFFYLTYYGSVDVAAIEDEELRQATELQIAHFGQCPRQILKRSHVRRLPTAYHKLSFFQLLSTYSQKGLQKSASEDDDAKSKRQSMTGEMSFMPFLSAPLSHWVHLSAPPPGPHADLIALRLAGTDRCLAVDAQGIYHTFRWAWRPEEAPEDSNFDAGCFVCQRELPRFKTVPRIMYTPTTSRPVVAISKTLFANKSVLLVLSAADALGGLGMQLVDPVKGNVRGEVAISAVHGGEIVCIATDPIGTAAGHGGVGGELAICGSADGNATIWRFMSSHFLPTRPRIRLSGHDGCRIHGVALCATLHLAATISSQRCCLYSIGNGSVIRSIAPPKPGIFDAKFKTTTSFAATPALSVSIHGFIVAVCETVCTDRMSERVVRSLVLFNMEGDCLGCKPLESWRGLPDKMQSTPDGTAVMVCCGRGVTLHRLSACRPLDFLDEWQVTEDDNDCHAIDLDLGPSLNRPVVAAAACSNGVLRLHALPGISVWSLRHSKHGLTQTVGSALAKPAQGFKKVMRDGFGIGKHLAGVGMDIGKEAQSEVKERGVGGFLGGVFGRKR